MYLHSRKIPPQEATTQTKQTNPANGSLDNLHNPRQSSLKMEEERSFETLGNQPAD